MGELIQTHLLTPESISKRSGFSTDQIYNGLDCCVTMEVLEELTRLSNQVPIIYDFERALQAPALEMMLRGFRIDQLERQKAQEALRATIVNVNGKLQKFAFAVWGKSLNPNSHLQLKDFFYNSMHLPEVWSSKKGKRGLSMDRETLEKIQQHYYAMPIVDAILTLREHSRSLKVLETEVDADGRMRTSYNIAGTTTGRWSSSKNAFGSGGNLQNWKERLRRVFVADPGYKLVAIDLEQADAREVGFALGVLFGDWSYLDACEGGDLHTTTAKLIWPQLNWTGDRKKDRAIADQIFYRDFSYRDMSKRGGHGTTYVGTPFTMARFLKVPLKLMEDFQQRFFSAYPGIPQLHLWTAKTIQTEQKITTYFGRERHFFGRPDDDATLREAVAHLGQSPTADRMSLGVLRIWQRLRHRLRLLAQLHDAVYFQVREEELEEIVPLALGCCEIAVQAPNGRNFVVPGEAKVGWNWSKRHDEAKALDPVKNPFNPDGLVKWTRGKPDARQRTKVMETVL